MSSEYFEEVEAGEEVRVVRRRGEVEGEEFIEEIPSEEVPEPEDSRVLYDVTKPELLETMMIASEILTQATLGEISISEAKKLYEKEVGARIKKLITGGVVVKKKSKARKAKGEKKAKVKAKVEKKEVKEEKAKKGRGRKAKGEKVSGS